MTKLDGGLNKVRDKNGGVKDESKVFGLSNWKDEGTLY